MRKLCLVFGKMSLCLLISVSSFGQASKSAVLFNVALRPETHQFLVEMQVPDHIGDTLEIRMPAWTPGYYQLLNFADNVTDVTATDKSGKSVAVIKSSKNGWKIASVPKQQVNIQYAVKAARAFVATPFVDTSHAYIAPTGVFMYIPGELNRTAHVSLNIPHQWDAATGLNFWNKDYRRFTAENFDILFDSPILIGRLEHLQPFEVKRIPHYFAAYKPGEFDRKGFMDDMQKIVTEASATIGDIPYKKYIFLGIGPGPGGIEHLNSTTFGFTGNALSTPEGKKRIYTFLAHEYFHHYNVKRIRPIELGPFDYDRENKTTMLWVSEGITVYYDQLVVFRAGLMSLQDLLNAFRDRLLGYENKPGRLFQSATEASFNTWTDGPFGRQDDEFNKTVSVYDKGAVLGLLLDFNIRNASDNKKSLDDVMRKLYREYYQQKKRGFTPEEFRAVCEEMAGEKLDDLFEYVSTTKPIDYKKYFRYGGLDIDTMPKKVTGAWLGITTRSQNDTTIVTNVDYQSPAWNAGIRRRMIITSVNGDIPKKFPAAFVLKDRQPGEKINFALLQQGEAKNIEIITSEKIEPDFKITVLDNPDGLQKRILDSWMKAVSSK